MAALIPPASRAIGKLNPATTCLLLCDIQDRFRPLIHNAESVISTSNFLCRVATTLEVPIVATEQYSKVFGHTTLDVLKGEGSGEVSGDNSEVPQIAVPTFEKKLFSMMTPEVKSHLSVTQPGVKSFILFGIEAHVCVQQTALDLLEEGYDVHVVVDAVSSQSSFDRELALTRMAQSGAFLTTAQSTAFMLMGTAEHANFKEVSKMIVKQGQIENAFHSARL
jgi:nicotinamidase-related amidase